MWWYPFEKKKNVLEPVEPLEPRRMPKRTFRYRSFPEATQVLCGAVALLEAVGNIAGSTTTVNTKNNLTRHQYMFNRSSKSTRVRQRGGGGARGTFRDACTSTTCSMISPAKTFTAFPVAIFQSDTAFSASR